MDNPPSARPTVKRRYWTMVELMQLLHVGHANTIRNMVRRGTLPKPVKFGNRVLFKADEVESVIADYEAARNPESPFATEGGVA